MKVRDHYRPRPGVLWLQLKCRCLVKLLGRRGLPPTEWPCKAHDGKKGPRQPERSIIPARLLKALGGRDMVKSLEAGHEIGKLLKRAEED